MSSIPVLVPRRADGGWRDRLWNATAGFYDAHPALRIVEGSHESGPFNRAAALNAAAELAGAWEIAVIIDADTLTPLDQVFAAAATAGAELRACLAYSELVSLSRPFTKDLIRDGRPFDPGPRWLAGARWKNPNAVSSCLAVPRELFDRLGGFDERFEGWGFEDRAFYLAAGALAGGVARIPGPAFHLWHPRSAEKDETSPTYQANRELCAAYRRAPHVSAMLEVLSR